MRKNTKNTNIATGHFDRAGRMILDRDRVQVEGHGEAYVRWEFGAWLLQFNDKSTESDDLKVTAGVLRKMNLFDAGALLVLAREW